VRHSSQARRSPTPLDRHFACPEPRRERSKPTLLLSISLPVKWSASAERNLSAFCRLVQREPLPHRTHFGAHQKVLAKRDPQSLLPPGKTAAHPSPRRRHHRLAPQARQRLPAPRQRPPPRRFTLSLEGLCSATSTEKQANLVS